MRTSSCDECPHGARQFGERGDSGKVKLVRSHGEPTSGFQQARSAECPPTLTRGPAVFLRWIVSCMTLKNAGCERVLCTLYHSKLSPMKSTGTDGPSYPPSSHTSGGDELSGDDGCSGGIDASADVEGNVNVTLTLSEWPASMGNPRRSSATTSPTTSRAVSDTASAEPKGVRHQAHVLHPKGGTLSLPSSHG